MLGFLSYHPVALAMAPQGAEASNLVLVARRLDGILGVENKGHGAARIRSCGANVAQAGDAEEKGRILPKAADDDGRSRHCNVTVTSSKVTPNCVVDPGTPNRPQPRELQIFNFGY
ncbi:hypothetical protein TARUN_8529 [Trichoderma arundinaceum]|uniref:Uncharacterized protein n=1 Tax=Trichoderma arundinaceum TaxID=490622 RepID=A0A395NCA5_TRIAR|nr:hypothetical protein TARUN_8529 [Trichoderma arundinaceum]